MQIKSFKSTKDYFISTNLTTTTPHSTLYIYITSLFIIFFGVLKVYAAAPNIQPIGLEFIDYTILVFLAVIIINLLVWWGSQTSSDCNFVPISILFLFINIHVPITNNFVQFYLLLEISAYTSLLFLALGYSANNTTAIPVALITSFILNFLASIIFYTFILSYSYQTLYPA